MKVATALSDASAFQPGVCQFAEEVAVNCTYTSECPEPLKCAVDSKCRAACVAAADCLPAQSCVSHVCADLDQLETTTGDLPHTNRAGGWNGVGDGDAAAPPAESGSLVEGGTSLNDASGASMSDALADVSIESEPDGAIARDAGAAEGASAEASADGPGAAAPQGVLGFLPSNFDSTKVPSLAMSAAADAGSLADAGTLPDVTISRANCDVGCLPAPTTITLNDGSQADLYAMRTLRIGTTSALVLAGPRPVVFAVADTVQIDGTLSVAAFTDTGGPGGFSYNVSAPGAGAPGGSAAAPSSGGGGGSYCGLGGHGGVTTGSAAAPGHTYGTPEIVPLVGGSPGGNQTYSAAGGGGGAVQIVATTSITVGAFGIVSAGGGGGQLGAAAGGSGGAILLEAPAIAIAGHLVANGGGGGGDTRSGDPASVDDQPAAGGTVGGGKGSGAGVSTGDDGTATTVFGAGGGGAGRIRLNTSGGAAAIASTAIISPSLVADAGVACATQGVILH